MSHQDTDFPLPATAEESHELLDVLIKEHAERSAERALERLGEALHPGNLSAYMADSACLRYPVTIVYSSDGLEEHQFAEVFFDGPESARACTLHIHPRFESRPESLPLLIAYMAPVINYGHIVTPEVCESYAATLLAMDTDAYYTALCIAVDQA